MAQAIAGEHDRLGRFVTLGHWLRTEKKIGPPPAVLFLPTGAGWTTWEPRPGLADPARLLVIGASSLRSLGIFLGLLALALAWCIGRWCSPPWYFRIWVIWQVGLCLALVWIPEAMQPVLWWPLAATALSFGCWLIRFSAAPRWLNQPTKSTDLAKVLIGGSSVWFLLMPGSWVPEVRSEGPEPYPVLLVESEPGKQLALISQDLVKKLGELESRGSPPTGAILLGARYQGKMKDKLAEFTVEYDIHNFSDKAKLLLPLAGVDLQEGSYLDGIPAFPIASPSPKSGYLVGVEGKGRHRLALSFTVRLAPAGDYQELRFSGPRLCTNMLEWIMDGPAQGLQLVNGLGEEKVLQKSAGSYELQGNLGREANVHLRWRLTNPPAASASVEVREAYFWDLRPGNASLSAALQFAPVKGTVSHFALDLPEDLDVRSLEATSANPARAAVPLALLREMVCHRPRPRTPTAR